mgnify:CR=1 FL=1
MERLAQLRPFLLCLSGLMGAGGVVLAAAASHGGDTRLLASASAMCLAHAPVLLGLFLAHRMVATATPAALALGLGTIVFAGDLLARQFLGARLLPLAAPAGGILMMLGWLLVAAGAFFRARDM